MIAAEALGIKSVLPSFHDPNLETKDLQTGLSFASGGSGYDPLTSKLLVCYFLFFSWFIYRHYFVESSHINLTCVYVCINLVASASLFAIRAITILQRVYCKTEESCRRRKIKNNHKQKPLYSIEWQQWHPIQLLCNSAKKIAVWCAVIHWFIASLGFSFLEGTFI